MPQYTANAIQTVASRDNVLFTDTPVPCSKGCVNHRDGAGIVTLRGCTNGCFTRYLVAYSANIAIPAGGTVAPISLALAVDGEPLPESTAISTPGAVSEFNGVSGFSLIKVPKGCCVQIAVENTSTEAIEVNNANLLVYQVC